MKDAQTYRQVSSSDISAALTLIKNGSAEVYVRASFLMSDQDTVDTSCCLRWNSASGDIIWSASSEQYEVVSQPVDNDGDTYANYSSTDGTLTNKNVIDILKAGKTVAS